MCFHYHIIFWCFQSIHGCFFLCSFLAVVQQKVALEKEAKLSILEAGVADVSTIFYFMTVFKSVSGHDTSQCLSK